MTQIQKIVVSGGGTGGHIYPALTIVKRLKELNPELECLYIGTDKGLELKIVPQSGIDFESIEIQGLERRLSFNNLRSIWLMLTSSFAAWRKLRSFQPEIVIGTGGYVCAPVLLASSLLKIPSLIHEQNSVAGVTNKFLSRFVDKIAICFEQVKDDFHSYEDKLVLTGNPRGQEVLSSLSDEPVLSKAFGLDDQKATVLIFGGSRGAPAINQAAIQSITNWLQVDYQVIIATGQAHFDDLVGELEAMELNKTNLRVVPYIDNMPEVFNAIDLVVCRSGATTLTELTALGLPSVLIPSPYVTNNHQYYNARSLVDQGAALLIEEKDLTALKLFQTVDQLINDKDQLESMRMKAKSLGIPDATDRIISTLEQLIEDK
ncbi:undecaprenyldiphospho-muramoylpentapeptide beta-N-acetylglucosaminyltransferase [Hutsoniella sourekii]|uniref:undecaprenyldiphospho-muramoylpentapeptide beta-N-acetylglucosaminyltransferase n=1 Tax=Hutsoniella sourekii TaxID=87650 RepID=UPI00048A2D7F|nr:undecaprenyldiphospho-muramoylpentapeptide beta-N-acetylglucosaminyltransferase [Hutsoniella sourekii]